MATRSKFLFDTDFNLPAADEAGAAPVAAFSAEAVAAAREEGMQEGIRIGAERARAEIDCFVADTLRSIVERIGAMNAEQQQHVAGLHADAARLAFAIASKLASTLIDRQPLTEVEALIHSCLAQMPSEPRIVVRVAEPLVDALRQRLDAITAQSGFEGKLALIGEPNVAIGDCRVEWADGGAERDLNALAARIEAAILRFVEATGAAGVSEEEIRKTPDAGMAAPDGADAPMDEPQFAAASRVTHG